MTIGERVKIAREKNGWSQDMLAERMGFTNKSSISKIETSGDKVSYKHVCRLAEALSISADYLLGKTNNPSIINSKEQEPEVVYFDCHVDKDGIYSTARSNHADLDAEYQMLTIIYHALTKENRKKVVGIMQQMLISQGGGQNDD